MCHNLEKMIKYIYNKYNIEGWILKDNIEKYINDHYLVLDHNIYDLINDIIKQKIINKTIFENDNKYIKLIM